MCKAKKLLLLLLVAGMTAGCSAKIAGSVRLVDQNLRPVTSDKPDGIVVNMINTTEALENASHSVRTDAMGNFESEKGRVSKGSYKIEVSRIGYKTSTTTAEVGKFGTTKVELLLKKISEGGSRSIRSKNSDEDKIINPGEVNIQPPTM